MFQKKSPGVTENLDYKKGNTLQKVAKEQINITEEIYFFELTFTKGLTRSTFELKLHFQKNIQTLTQDITTLHSVSDLLGKDNSDLR